MAGGMAAPAGVLDDEASDETTAVADEVDAGSTAAGAAADPPAARVLVVLSTIAAVVPIMVAAFRAVARDWFPTSDNALFTLRAHDVFTRNNPLLGTWSSASIFSKKDMNHPGPMHFDLLALPVRLLGPGAGTAIGIALINSAAVVVIAWLLCRRKRRGAAIVAMTGCAVLAWSMGSELLYDPWNLHSALFPFAAVLVATWCVVDGDLVALPVMVFWASDLLELHLSYVLIVPALLLLAVGAVVLRVRRGQLTRRSALRWGGIALAVLLVCWAQPLWEQAQPHNQGNFTRLLNGAGDDSVVPTTDVAVEIVGDTLAVPPAWLPSSFSNPTFILRERPTWQAALGLGALVGALVVLGWRARRRGSTLVASGSVVALVALAFGYVTIAKMPIRMGVTATYARFLWPLGMLIWVVVALGLAEEVRLRWPGARRLVALFPLVAVVACAGAIPHADNAHVDQKWPVQAMHALEDDVVAGLEGKGAVEVVILPHPHAMVIGPAIMVVLQDHGIPFYTDSKGLARQVGTGRLYSEGDAEWKIVVKATRAAGAGKDEHLIAQWDGLTPADADEMDELRATLTGLIAEHGMPIAPEARDIMEQYGGMEMLEKFADANADPDPESLLKSGDFTQMAGWLDPSVFPKDMTDRWAELEDMRENRVIRVYLAPIEDEE
jgi:hypothetical protein